MRDWEIEMLDIIRLWRVAATVSALGVVAFLAVGPSAIGNSASAATLLVCNKTGTEVRGVNIRGPLNAAATVGTNELAKGACKSWSGMKPGAYDLGYIQRSDLGGVLCTQALDLPDTGDATVEISDEPGANCLR